jgi:hypothetical protein
MPFKRYGVFIFVLAEIFLNGFNYARAQLQMPQMTNDGVQEKVQAAFSDAPGMAMVAQCESGFRQFAGSGQVLRGGAGGQYIGIFQISEAGHAAFALSLGYDIYTIDGNIGYARYMYNRQGLRPWISCAPDAPAAAPAAGGAMPAAIAATAGTAQLTKNLQLNMVDPQVVALQQLLNAAGFTLAQSGPGSPGSETDKFGALTRQAVQKFQCSQNITCAGSESTTGYGRFGPLTRAALLALAARPE